MSDTAATNMGNNIKGFFLIAVLNFMAAIDWSNWMTYTLNAITGGIIWIGFKILSDNITERMKNKKRRTSKTTIK